MNHQNYQVLARKWRPHHFKDLVGQEPILRMLSNALEQKRIHHAYLFTGTRGVGKTTLARILAKCLNCETNVSSTPCGTCHACTAIDAGQFIDLFEVDAASRTKVEDTRELLDNVMYPPSVGRYKVYLIDEVHMLSNHSFNALLKTLEEPPEHVKFLLATTDPKRLPVTILSRCLQFNLKRITPELISQHLAHICSVEKIIHDTKALERIARAADGSMRDALSLLDQAIAYGHGMVNLAEVNAMLGCMAQDDLLPLLEALAQQDGNALFQQIDHLAESAPDFAQVLEELISILHKVAIAQLIPDLRPAAESIQFLTQHLTPEDIQLYYQIALLGRRDLSFTPSPQQGFEMIMLRMLAFQPGMPSQQTIAPISTLKGVEKTQALQTTATPITQASPVAPSRVESTATYNWREMLPKLELSGMAYALASNCTLESINGDKVILAISANHEAMLNPKLKERMTEALTRYLKQPIHLEIHPTGTELNTPIKQQQHENAQRLTDAKQSVLQDPKVKQFIQMYDATVDISLLS